MYVYYASIVTLKRQFFYDVLCFLYKLRSKNSSVELSVQNTFFLLTRSLLPVHIFCKTYSIVLQWTSMFLALQGGKHFGNARILI
jgi:hypothetical protein